ncbi:DEAD/DEAH box helicase family protein [Wolbachia endosymbiont of Folsomia candida]|uniref:hypothetical protein n=1 Tax=Wolbachia endosymbiont of Folsomia candida TaxID=169402 RepID=UPI000B2AEA42|nr:hypothetical protein [Wolbachia endosymbiont of Folsomia candida]APR98207.1 hypothetical protein ASM33_02760 [Wolbachia endosymbiont of Folsomia candida]
MTNRPNPTPLEAAKNVYNSYLLLHKLNELKVNDGKSFNDVILKAINESKEQVEFKVEGKKYQIKITKKGVHYKLEVLGQHTKPEVKDVLSYTGEEIIGLWAKSEVSFEKDTNNVAFAVGLRDEARLQDLKVGGLGKKVPFNLRFANFYKVIEILEDESKTLKERLRLANNIATGSGKTGDIALLKLWAYLTDTPCITMVPDHLIDQSNNFDKEFLPDEVVVKFAKSFTEQNTRFATTTFTEALEKQWNLFNNTYGKNNNEPALFIVDEPTKLKANVVQMVRAIYIALYNLIAIFSATPNAFLSKEFQIPEQNQILLSPKERTALRIGKIPIFYVANGIYSMCHNNTHSRGYVGPEEQYIQKYENTHTNLDGSKKNNQDLKKSINAAQDNQEKSQLFLRFIDKTLDSKAYKVTLIASEKKYHNRDDYITNIVEAITGTKRLNDVLTKDNLELERRGSERKESFFTSIRKLNTGLSDEEIKSFIEENLDTRVGGELLASTKLRNIIDIFNEYRKSGKAFNKNEISEFIENKYGITNTSSTNFKSELTDIIWELGDIYRNNPKLQENFDRNYRGDKKLHDNIFSKSKRDTIKKFCEKDVIISYFDRKFRRFNAEGIETIENLSKDDKDNVLNFVKAGFVPKIISKELAMGIDAPIDYGVLLAPEPSEILSPDFWLQFTGRVGRDPNRKGKCYVDFYIAEQEYVNLKYKKELSNVQKQYNPKYGRITSAYPDSIPKEYRDFPIVPTKLTISGADYRLVDKKYMHYETPMYLNLENISTLSGKGFFDAMERGNEKYYNDEINIYSIYASLMSENIHSTFRQFLRKDGAVLTNEDGNLCYHDKDSTKRPISSKVFYDSIFQSIKDTLSVINTHFNYDKERVLKVFYNALLMQECHKFVDITHNDIIEDKYFHSSKHYLPQLPLQSIMAFIYQELASAMKNEMAVKGSNAIPKYSDDMSLEDWAHYIVHTKPMSFENLVKADPNSNAPIFMEQKERSQRKNVSVHNASAKLSNTTGSSVPAKAPDAKASTGGQQKVGFANTIQNKPTHQVSEPFMTGPTVSLEDPSTTNESPQQTSTKKKVMYGFMAVSPFLAVGIYTAIVFLGSTGLAFNPAVAASIFIGVALAAIALFGIIKVCEKVSREKQENPDIDTCTTIEDIGTPENLTDKTQDCPVGA